MAIINRTEGTVMRSDSDTQRRIRDVTKVGQRIGMTLERAWQIGVKSKEGWGTTRIVRGRGLE